MKKTILIITAIGAILLGCQPEITCEDRILTDLTGKNFYADSIQTILFECGNLDSADMDVTRTPLFTEIVEMEDWSAGKYNVKRFVSDFQKYAKTEKFIGFKKSLIMQKKTYSEADWPADKEYLISRYQLSPEDVSIFEEVVKNPTNSSMNFTQAYQEMNKVKGERILESIEADKLAK